MKAQKHMNTLFDISPTPLTDKSHYTDKFCRTCKYRQPWECGSKVIQYCVKHVLNFMNLRNEKII
jgi:hypothetical protein